MNMIVDFIQTHSQTALEGLPLTALLLLIAFALPRYLGAVVKAVGLLLVVWGFIGLLQL